MLDNLAEFFAELGGHVACPFCIFYENKRDVPIGAREFEGVCCCPECYDWLRNIGPQYIMRVMRQVAGIEWKPPRKWTVAEMLDVAKQGNEDRDRGRA